MVGNVSQIRDNSNVWFDTYKQEVIAGRGIIATNHPLASVAGAEIFSHGGNAFDAATASLFALTVVEPMMISVFGSGFFIVRDAESDVIETIDNYGVAPKAATEDMYEMVEERKPGQNIFETVGRKNQVGHLSVATPGSLKAWEHIVERYGNLELKEVIVPAIRLARYGFRATPYLSFFVKEYVKDLESYTATAKTFLPSGKPLNPGQRVVMPEYAKTLEEIAFDGSDVLYKGDLGKAVVDDMEEKGGLITTEDLESYELIMREPVKGIYRDDFEVYAMPPGSSGGTHIIQMLNLLELYDVTQLGFGTVEYLHLIAEILKIAFSDRQRYMGDPSTVQVPVAGLTSKRYALKRSRELGKMARIYSAGDPFIYENEGENTTHISAMDSDGNMVAATQTLNGAFGSKVTVPGTGILLNNCMALFDPRPGRANSVAGEKRMLSSMSPTIVLSEGDPYLCIGTPGGLRIFPSVWQAIVNIIDFDMTIQQAVEAPRIWTMGIEGTPGKNLLIESGFPNNVKTGLTKKGHEIVVVPKVAGGMNGILRDSNTGLLHGGACWRADGTPIGISGGKAAPKALEPMPPV